MKENPWGRTLVLLVLVMSVTIPGAAQWVQQGPKLVGTGPVDAGYGVLQGYSVSLSADGNTAIVGGPYDDNWSGAAWIWTRSGGVWTQQGPKLVGSGPLGQAKQGSAVSLSADGNTALVGGENDNGGIGATWVWTRSGGVWTQQGPKLVGSGTSASRGQGCSVSISADGNTALVGGMFDNNMIGAAWVFKRSGGIWTQQGSKLVGSGAIGSWVQQGKSVALSGDGNTAIVGGWKDNSDIGAAWIWTRSGGVWTQQGPKLVGSGAVDKPWQGESVAISEDGNTAIVGGTGDNSSTGAVWVWTRSGGVWTQQGPKLAGSGATGAANQGHSAALSADGNIALVGGPDDGYGPGATWMWTRSGAVWTQLGTKLMGLGAVGDAAQGSSVALSADGKTALVGGIADSNYAGAAWVFVAGPTCSLTCSASAAPSTGQPPLDVTFAASATPTNCTGEVTYAWSFGDGDSSTRQNPTHRYATAGTYHWTLTAAADGQTCSANGTITVSASGSKPGDCDGNGTVSIGEVQKAINMFLGLQAPGCGVDCNSDGAISIGEVQKVINAFLGLASSC